MVWKNDEEKHNRRKEKAKISMREMRKNKKEVNKE